jgi:hypothetical protein
VLSPTASGALTLIGEAEIEVPGSVFVNSNSTGALVAIGSSSVTAGSISVMGSVSSIGGATFSPAPVTGATNPTDPYSGLPVPQPGAERGSVVCSADSSVTLLPGIYDKVIANGNCSVELEPGEYILRGGITVTGEATVSGSGVLLYNTSKNYPLEGGQMGKIVLGGSGSIDLSPAESGAYAGISIFQARDNTQPISIVGHAVFNGELHGTVYAPSAQLTIIGGGLTHASLVVNTLRVIGNADASLTADGANADPSTLGAIVSAGQLVTGALSVAIQSPDGTMTDEQLARIRDSIDLINQTFGAFGVQLIEIEGASGDFADIRVAVSSNSPCGNQSTGILGCTTADGSITLISGWNWYSTEGASAITSSQFDLQTIVTHELGHSIGVDHSSDAQSAMYYALARGMIRRDFTQADLDQLKQGGGGGGQNSLTSALRVAADGTIIREGHGHDDHASDHHDADSLEMPVATSSSQRPVKSTKAGFGGLMSTYGTKLLVGINREDVGFGNIVADALGEALTSDSLEIEIRGRATLQQGAEDSPMVEAIETAIAETLHVGVGPEFDPDPLELWDDVLTEIAKGFHHPDESAE